MIDLGETIGKITESMVSSISANLKARIMLAISKIHQDKQFSRTKFIDENSQEQAIARLVDILAHDSCQAKDTCNGSCLTKTYNYQDLASVTFTSQQTDGINYFSIILTGYNIREGEYQKVAVAIDGNPGANVYSCERNSSGYIASYYARSFDQHTAGSSLYRDNTLYCFWTMCRSSYSWPKRSDGSSLDLEIDFDHKIFLADDDTSYLVTKNTNDLPIYQMNFLKCCHAVYGNDEVQLFVRQTDNANEFTLQLANISSSMANFAFLELKASDESELTFTWIVQNAMLFVTLKLKYIGLTPINFQVLYKHSWSGGIFTWAIPIVIKGFSEDYDTRERVYDLKITLDDDSVYKKSGITLKSLGLTQIPSTFFVFSVFVFHQIIY
uniref:Uncharacterized protein n=1 Tax=Tetranychus urticae TaxID=32264 RepID=T1K434_TETUR